MPQPVRLGAIVPAQNVMVERDFMASCPDGASVHFARADIDQSKPLHGQLADMIEAAPKAARVLAKADVRAICFACTSASFLNGPGRDEESARQITQASGVPAITTSTAVLNALAALGVGTVAVVTPYVDWVVEAEKEFLEKEGFRVCAISGMGLERGSNINAVELQAVIEATIGIDRPEAGALFISCTDLAAIGAIEDLESRLGKPVVTSNQASLWALCLKADIPPPAGYGRLMAVGPSLNANQS
ncbi:MAG: maleate cis-trans isomerase [Pseudomonadota bacterium]